MDDKTNEKSGTGGRDIASNSLDKKDNRDRMVRWQKITIDQLGYVINLIITLSVALLGYFFSLLRDTTFVPGHSARCALLFSFLAIALSVFCGLLCTLIRLLDFRGTAMRTKSRVDAPSKSDLERMGNVTWRLFYIQLSAFTLSVVLLAITLLLTYGEKLV
ncbi:MAG: hypothetical protein ACLQGT_04605 [Terracidiphilus sp.]